jgi:hypothetical protein
VIHFADTITKLGAEAAGAVVVSGSHGGVYPGHLAAEAQVRAVILNDAGVGKDNAGIGSLAYLQTAGIAAAMVSHMSCRIGNTGDMARRGVISYCNALAAACEVRAGMPCSVAAEYLERAKVLPGAAAPPVREGRAERPKTGTRTVVLIDSASLVKPEDVGQIVVTGSHGGLIGGIAAKALAVEAWAAVFHDAGVGIDDAGIARLPVLDARGIAAMTAAGTSARIGDAHSILNDGVVSFANEVAIHRGARIGERIAEVIERWRSAP